MLACGRISIITCCWCCCCCASMAAECTLFQHPNRTTIECKTKTTSLYYPPIHSSSSYPYASSSGKIYPSTFPRPPPSLPPPTTLHYTILDDDGASIGLRVVDVRCFLLAGGGALSIRSAAACNSGTHNSGYSVNTA